MSRAWKPGKSGSVWPWMTNTGTSFAPVGTGIAYGERNAPPTCASAVWAVGLAA